MTITSRTAFELAEPVSTKFFTQDKGSKNEMQKSDFFSIGLLRYLLLRPLCTLRHGTHHRSNFLVTFSKHFSQNGSAHIILHSGQLLLVVTESSACYAVSVYLQQNRVWQFIEAGQSTCLRILTFLALSMKASNIHPYSSSAAPTPARVCFSYRFPLLRPTNVTAF